MHFFCLYLQENFLSQENGKNSSLKFLFQWSETRKTLISIRTTINKRRLECLLQTFGERKFWWRESFCVRGESVYLVWRVSFMEWLFYSRWFDRKIFGDCANYQGILSSLSFRIGTPPRSKSSVTSVIYKRILGRSFEKKILIDTFEVISKDSPTPVELL